MIDVGIMETIEIKQYSPEYLDGVILTWERASQVGHPFLSAEFLRSEKENIPLLYLPNGDAWVALYEGEIVGFSILHGNEVGALFVDPNFHGRGVGYTLMNKAHELHAQLKVEVFKNNVIGNKFYSRYGFELVREYFHKDSGMTMLCLEYKRDIGYE